MSMKQDMKVYYETFPDALYRCDFCTRTFRTIKGLRTHAVRMHAVEMDAAREAYQVFAAAHGFPEDCCNVVATDYKEE